MQYTKDIILKNARIIGNNLIAGLNVRNNQLTQVYMGENPVQNIQSIIKDNMMNTIKFDRAISSSNGSHGPIYNAKWATALKTKTTDREAFIPAANIKLVAVAGEGAEKKYYDIRSTEELVSASKDGMLKIQGFITAVRADKSELISSIQDAQRIAMDMIKRSQSVSYTPKLIIRGLNEFTRDSIAQEILFVRDSGVVSGINIQKTMNHIAKNEMLNKLLSSEFKENNTAVEAMPSIHINMSEISLNSLVSSKLMRAGTNGSHGVSDWHFRTFSDMGLDTFTPCHLTIGVSPKDDKFHFAKTLECVGEKGEKWTMKDIPTRNWKNMELVKIYQSAEVKPDNGNAPGNR